MAFHMSPCLSPSLSLLHVKDFPDENQTQQREWLIRNNLITLEEYKREVPVTMAALLNPSHQF